MPLHTILDALENGGDIDPRWVAVTFDDGYRDFVDQALPILAETGIQATVFVSTTTLEGKELFFDAIQRLLDAARGRAGTVALGEADVRWDVRDPRRTGETAFRIAMVVRELAPEARTRALASLKEAIGTTENGPRRECYLDADQLATLPPNVDVGSHTVNHYNLAGLSDEQLSSELAVSAETLSEVTGRPTEVLAYPFGKAWSYDDHVAHAARAAGYRAALTTAPGRVTHDSDPMSLPRIGAGHSLSRLRVNLMGVYL